MNKPPDEILEKLFDRIGKFTQAAYEALGESKEATFTCPLCGSEAWIREYHKGGIAGGCSNKECVRMMS
jgi:hypothetical protein